MKKLLFILLLLSGLYAQAQESKPDTTPVWVVYLDSVKLFSSYPEYEMRVEAVAGWRVRTLSSQGKNLEVIDVFYDTNGERFLQDVVLYCKPRKVTPNPFRQ